MEKILIQPYVNTLGGNTAMFESNISGGRRGKKSKRRGGKSKRQRIFRFSKKYKK